MIECTEQETPSPDPWGTDTGRKIFGLFNITTYLFAFLLTSKLLKVEERRKVTANSLIKIIYAYSMSFCSNIPNSKSFL